MVRPSAPRFMNFGDKIELPVIVQNQTDSPMETSVAVRASNADLTDGSGKKITVPGNSDFLTRAVGEISVARANGDACFHRRIGLVLNDDRQFDLIAEVHESGRGWPDHQWYL